MPKPRHWMAFVALAACASSALAGPGGKIASSMFSTPWGRVALVVLAIVLAPVIIYVMVRERHATRRAQDDLRYMARLDPLFEWTAVRERVQECFQAIHSAWSVEDVSRASHWMTDWYWQNQQQQLDRWARQGLVNVCEVKRVNTIRPLLFVHRNTGAAHEGSSLAVKISARMTDYLQQRDGGKVVEGDTSMKDVETIWTFVLRDGQWRVNAIDEGSMVLEVARLARDLPPIESTVDSTVLRR